MTNEKEHRHPGNDAVERALTSKDREMAAAGHHLRFKDEDEIRGGAVGPAWWIKGIEAGNPFSGEVVAPFRARADDTSLGAAVPGAAEWVPLSALRRAAKVLNVKIQEV